MVCGYHIERVASGVIYWA